LTPREILKLDRGRSLISSTIAFFSLQIYSVKHGFNERLLALRDKKLRIVSEIGDDVDELKRIQSILGPDLSKPLPAVPTIDPCETPEK